MAEDCVQQRSAKKRKQHNCKPVKRQPFVSLTSDEKGHSRNKFVIFKHIMNDNRLGLIPELTSVTIAKVNINVVFMFR